MVLRQGQGRILAANLLYLGGFGTWFAARANYEFVLYVGVIGVLGVLILATNARVRYPNSVLWGLTVWGLLHMGGGSIRVGDGVLYGWMIARLSESYDVLRFDQLVHAFGFGVATLLVHHLLRPLLRPELRHTAALSLVVAMAGLGVGALNEIVEFAAVVLVPETGVGGYTNTALDLVADLVGALGAVLYLHLSGEITAAEGAPARGGAGA